MGTYLASPCLPKGLCFLKGVVARADTLGMPIRFHVVHGETEHISFRGVRTRRPTVLMKVQTRVGTLTLSKKVAILGCALMTLQIMDGALTYLGLKLLGVQMEGNSVLRGVIQMYGIAPALFIAKGAALVGVGVLMSAAHRRKWVRPIIFALCAVYTTLAVVPWLVILLRLM